MLNVKKNSTPIYIKNGHIWGVQVIIIRNFTGAH